MLRLPLDEASAKVRTGRPIDEDDDKALPVWAGHVPLRLVAGDPVADDGIRALARLRPRPLRGTGHLSRSAEELAVLATEELQRPDVVPFPRIASTLPITHQWSPASATGRRAVDPRQHALDDRRTRRLGAVRQRTELGALLRGKARQTSIWSAARMFTQNDPVASMRGQLVDLAGEEADQRWLERRR